MLSEEQVQRNANSRELSDAFDMLKDVSMAMYYCKITEAMDNAEMKPPISPPDSIYEKTKRFYTESKMTSEDKQMNMHKLEGWLNTIKDEIKAKASTMSAEEKTMAKNIMNGIANSI